MSDSLAIIVRRIDRSLDLMTDAPDMWGSPESLELQALLLLEMRAIATRPSVLRGRPSGVREAYSDFVNRSLNGEDRPFLLSSILGEKIAQLPSMLRMFVDDFDKWLPPDTQDDDDVVLELEGEPGSTSIPFDVVCRYYEQFHKGLHDLTNMSRTEKERRSDSGLATRATTYAMPEISVVPRRDAGPLVTLRLTQPREGSADMFDRTYDLERNVSTAFAKAARVIRWSEPRSPVEDPKNLFPTTKERIEAASHSMRLVPEEGIKVVRLRGKLLANEVIEVKPEQAARILTILEDAYEPTDFGKSGDVRAIDLDQGWFRIRFGTAAGDTIKCWVKERKDLMVMAHAAFADQKKLRVLGRRFDRRRSHFVVVDDAIAD